MNASDVANISQDCLFVLLKVSFPILAISLIVGLLVSLLQAMTQIQEPTLAFVPKLICISLALIISMSYIGQTIYDFSSRLMSEIIHMR